MTLAAVPEYDPDRVTERGGRAVVVGAGMAGLLAARVLADAFSDVTVLERDPIPADAESDESGRGAPIARRGVPQSRHVHVMLEAGRATLEAHFPGFRSALLSAGGLEIDGARDVRVYAEGDFLADGPDRIPQYASSRPLYERLVRRRVAALDSVELRPGCAFTDYRLDASSTAVDGVAFRNAAGDVETLDASLVVDATGRASRTPAWLDRNGFAAPPVDEVAIDLAYSTVRLGRPPGDCRAFLVPPEPPRKRGFAMFPVEDEAWIATFGGVHGDHPPTTPAELTAYAAEIPGPDVAELLDATDWLSDEIAHYRFPSTLRRRYEALDRFPAGLVVIGDAIASFNPLYGQGMSVAALESLLLHDCLAANHGDAANDGSAAYEPDGAANDRGSAYDRDGAANDDGALGPRVFERAESVVDAAWLLAVGPDARFPQTTGPQPRGTGLVNRYVSRLHRTAHADGTVREAFTRVVMMEQPPSALMHPEIAWRVLTPTR